MGGLRDDTGAHNSKDIFGYGAGLEQTKKGAYSMDGMYHIKKGKVKRMVGEDI